MANGVRSIGHLSYKKIGTGPRVLFAFHGFGQDKSIFDSWEAALSETYTIYACDLFYHGESTRPLNKLSKEEWKTFISQVMEKNGITSFSLLGYSLGGRFAISTALSFPQRTEELFLIAPDGIFLSIWFKLATTPGIKLLFKYFMLNPDKLEKWLQFNEKVKVVNKYIADFVRKEMGTPENRKRVYISWNYFKSLGYKRSTLIAKFKQYQFRRRIIIGSKDYVITPKGILPIIDKMTKFEVHILEKKHHQLLGEDVANLISNQKDSNA